MATEVSAISVVNSATPKLRSFTRTYAHNRSFFDHTLSLGVSLLQCFSLHLFMFRRNIYRSHINISPKPSSISIHTGIKHLMGKWFCYFTVYATKPSIFQAVHIKGLCKYTSPIMPNISDRIDATHAPLFQKYERLTNSSASLTCIFK